MVYLRFDNEYDITQAFPFSEVTTPIVSPLSATSKDDGQNAEITYSLVAGNEHKRFRIDSKTGVISLVQPLDYEGMTGTCIPDEVKVFNTSSILNCPVSTHYGAQRILSF